MLFIYAQNPNSQGAKELAAAMGIKRIKHVDSSFTPGEDKTIINWGSSVFDFDVGYSRIINYPSEVGLATNKLNAFNSFKSWGEDWCPLFTTSIEEAQHWQSRGKNVISRAILSGSGGAGIGYHTPEDTLPSCPLYTQYIPKSAEYRVHVGAGGDHIIDHQKKGRRLDTPDDQVNWRIRNHDNGFIYMREGRGDTPQLVFDSACSAIRSLELDFGAVDVIWNAHREQAYVLEVNTAPGLQGQTVDSYCQYFKEYYG